ncbi:MAG: sigma 54-interacting transcriptional regulator [Bacillota bacterium]
MKLLQTVKDDCHECYACVRNCPVRAVQVKDGRAEIMEERCINCAQCINICSQKAKEVYNFKNDIKRLLKSDKKVIAGLAPSFPASSEASFAEWKMLLRNIGFNKIYEVAWGAEMVIEEYKEYLNNIEKTVLSSTCPVAVKFIEKYYPELVENLAPIISPMKALVKYINEVEGEDYQIVMIGPCQAKKNELREEDKVAGTLTYNELFEIVEEVDNKKENINNNNFSKNKKSLNGNNQPSSDSRKMAMPGGLLKALRNRDAANNAIRVEGEEKISDLFNSIIEGELSPGFVDLLFCEGCINGVDLANKGYFKKLKSVNNFIENEAISNNNIKENRYIEEGPIYNKEISNNLDLSTNFIKDSKILPEASEDEIWEILNKTNKYEESDLLNCGACGYETCKNKAIAVYQGIAEVEMCLPYLISEKRDEIEKVQKLNVELDRIIDSSFDGMVVIDDKGKIIRANSSYLKMINSTRENIIGKKMNELEKEKVVYPSVAMLSLNEKREISLLQKSNSNKRILATATPVFENNGSLTKVIVNARDLEKFYKVMKNNNENQKLKNYLDKENDEIETDSGYIIKKSLAMKKIVNMAERIAESDSTVLITGESGTGKEVIARYIYDKSEDRNNFVKINCAAIPETLLESELFGYETGAFSGAKKEGKAGKIELADNGILFLDEIGEIPLNMQAKLLQVIQEHKVSRIGGVKSIDVDFRLIAATNRDLEKMVKENKFREDLYYRLYVVPIEIPPLRNRREDIKPLVNLVKKKMSRKYDKDIVFTENSYEFLEQRQWPGNVRELNNLIERIIVTSSDKIINKSKLEKFIKNNEAKSEPSIAINELIPLKQAVTEVEKRLLEMAKENGASTYDIADKLDVNQSTVVRKLKKYFKN